MKKEVISNVRSHQRRTSTGVVKVVRHNRSRTIEVDVVTKAQYRKEFKCRSTRSQSQDKAKTKINSIPRNKTQAELKHNWNSKKYDWIGIDAGGLEKVKAPRKMPKNLHHTQSTKYDDAMYDRNAFHDSSLSRHENDMLERGRFSFRNISSHWR